MYFDNKDFLELCNLFSGASKMIETLKSELLSAQYTVEAQAERIKALETRNEELNERIEKSIKKIDDLTAEIEKTTLHVERI